MDASCESLEQVLALRAQLKDLTPRTKGSLGEKLEKLDAEFAALEGAAQPNFFGVPPKGRQPENFSTLNQHFAAILAIADSADSAPTTQAISAYHELNEEAAKLMNRWSALTAQQLPDLNGDLKKAGLPALDPKKPLASAPSGGADGDAEPE